MLFGIFSIHSIHPLYTFLWREREIVGLYGGKEYHTSKTTSVAWVRQLEKPQSSSMSCDRPESVEILALIYGTKQHRKFSLPSIDLGEMFSPPRASHTIISIWRYIGLHHYVIICKYIYSCVNDRVANDWIIAWFWRDARPRRFSSLIFSSYNFSSGEKKNRRRRRRETFNFHKK